MTTTNCRRRPTASATTISIVRSSSTNVLGMERATVREMLVVLRRTYCSTMGIEFMHISDPAEKAWIQERIEGPDKSIDFTENGKRAILNRLVAGRRLRELHRRQVQGHQAVRPGRRREPDPGT